MLLLKGSLMGSVKGKDAEENDAEIEMSNDIVYTDNPLQSVSDSKASNIDTDSRVYELESEITDVKTKNTYLMTENTDLKTEITDLNTEITILQQKIKKLESKGNDNNDEQSEKGDV